MADKHVNSTQAVARQPLSKQIPAAADMHAVVEILLDYNNGNNVFCVVYAEML
jgi:hypothetical protein